MHIKAPTGPGTGERLLEAEPPLQARSTCQMPPVIYSEASDILPTLISHFAHLRAPQSYLQWETVYAPRQAGENGKEVILPRWMGLVD